MSCAECKDVRVPNAWGCTKCGEIHKHRDTIALRKCRAELATYRASAEECMRVLEAAIKQAESERDTARAALAEAVSTNELRTSERDTARSTAEALRNELSRDMTASSEKALAALQAKVARAVAELKCLQEFGNSEYLTRALEALR